MKNNFIVDTKEEYRVDKFISEKLTEYSRSYIQKMLKNQEVTVNNVVVKANYKLKANDEVSITISAPILPDIIAENIPMNILYEDEDILIVNKDKNMVVHPAPGNYTGTLVNGVMYHCKDSLSGINGVMRPGIVHRIDKNTTGALVICKNDQSHQFIADLLKEHNISRKYRAIVHGVIKEDKGTIEGPIGRHEKDRKKMAINYKNGKAAVTHFTVLNRFEKFTYIECELETGRTHQIRVHMASINHPLLGDDVYSNLKSKFNLQGQSLHAYTLGFTHPKSFKYMEFIAPLPEYFNKLLQILQ